MYEAPAGTVVVPSWPQVAGPDHTTVVPAAATVPAGSATPTAAAHAVSSSDVSSPPILLRRKSTPPRKLGTGGPFLRTPRTPCQRSLRLVDCSTTVWRITSPNGGYPRPPLRLIGNVSTVSEEIRGFLSHSVALAFSGGEGGRQQTRGDLAGTQRHGWQESDCGRPGARRAVTSPLRYPRCAPGLVRSWVRAPGCAGRPGPPRDQVALPSPFASTVAMGHRPSAGTLVARRTLGSRSRPYGQRTVTPSPSRGTRREGHGARDNLQVAHPILPVANARGRWRGGAGMAAQTA